MFKTLLVTVFFLFSSVIFSSAITIDEAVAELLGNGRTGTLEDMLYQEFSCTTTLNDCLAAADSDFNGDLYGWISSEATVLSGGVVGDSLFFTADQIKFGTDRIYF